MLNKLSLMVIILGNGISDTGSNPGKPVYISLHTNAFKKGMNPSILSQPWENDREDWVL